MQAITPQDVHHNVYYETLKAGAHFKYPDDLSTMKTLQDSYRKYIDYDPLDFSRAWEEDWKRFAFGPLGPSYHDLMRLSEKDEECNLTLWKYVSRATPALLFPPLPPMLFPGWSPAKYCSHCGTNVHKTNECVSHAMKIVQSAARSLKQRGFKSITPDITQHGKRQRMHAGPGWSHPLTVRYNDSGTLYCETGIAHLSSSASLPTPTKRQ